MVLWERGERWRGWCTERGERGGEDGALGEGREVERMVLWERGERWRGWCSGRGERGGEDGAEEDSINLPIHDSYLS